MKKRAAYFLYILIGSLLFIGCQKEYSFNDGLTNTSGSNGGTASYSFIDSTKICSGSIVKGNYTQTVNLDFSNTVQIKVQVDSVGSYTITTENINGIGFSSSGTFTTKGLQSVTLVGTGKPANTGIYSFTPGKNGCNFKITCIAAPITSNNCKACTYIIACAGSTYLYMDSIIVPNFLDTGSVIIVNARKSNFLTSTDTIINGNIFNKIAVSDGSTINYNYLNCINGQTRLISYSATSAISGNTLSKVDIIELKANAVVGTNWTDTTELNSTNNLYRTSTIMQKGISRTFMGITYKDVIKIKVVQSIGTAPAGITEYFFANGIGLVELISYNINPITNDTYVGIHTLLKSYYIP